MDILNLVKNKSSITLDFSKIDPYSSDFQQLFSFVYKSLPQEQQEVFRQTLTDAMRNKTQITLDFSQLPLQNVELLTGKSQLLKQYFGIEQVPTRSEIEERLQQIEQVRKQRALKTKEVKEKEELQFIRDRILPLVESGLPVLEQALKLLHQQTIQTVNQQLATTEDQIKITKQQLEELQTKFKTLPPFSPDAVVTAQAIKDLRERLVSLVSTRNNWKSHLDELNNERYWYKQMFEGLYDAIMRDFRVLPYFRNIFKAEEEAEIKALQDKRRRGEKLTVTEEAKLRDYETRYLRQRGFAYTIGYTLADMPAWGGEIATTAGVLKVAGVPSAVVSLITKDLGVKKQFPKKLLEFITYGAMQGITNVPLLSAELFNNMLDQQIVVPQGDKLVEILNRRGDDFWTALGKAVGVSAVEHASEMMGVFVQNFKRFFPKFILSKWIKKRGLKSVDDVLSAIKKGIKWDGIIGEVFEEEIARAVTGVTGLEEGGWIPPWTDQGLQILLQEMITIGLWGGVLDSPNLVERIKTITQGIKNFRQKQAPPLITDEDVKAFRESRQRKLVEPTPEQKQVVEQIVQEAIATPPPSTEPLITVPPKVKPKTNLFDNISTIENLQQAYENAVSKNEQRKNDILQRYDNLIKDLTEEIEKQATLVNADPQVLKEQIQQIVSEIQKDKESSLQQIELQRLSYLASYKKRLKELEELQKIPEPEFTAIQLWYNTFPVPVTPSKQEKEQELKKLQETAQKTQEFLDTHLPTLNNQDKIDIIGKLYDYEIMSLPFEQIVLKEEVQKVLRPLIQYDYGLIDSIAKYFDLSFFDMLKIAYIEDTKEYILFDGHHRYLALKKLQEEGRLQDYFPLGVPVVVMKFKTLNDLVAKSQHLRMINEARHGLNIVELAKAFKDMIDSGLTIDDIAVRYNRKRGDVVEILKINKLSQSWKDLAVNKEKLPSLNQRTNVDLLLLTMADLVEKYNIPEEVQTDILNNWVIKEKLSATTLRDWLETLFKTIQPETETIVSGTLDLFTKEQWKSLRSKFTDTLREIQKKYKEYRSLRRSYQKIQIDLQKAKEEGQPISTQTLDDVNKRLEQIQDEIRKLQIYLLETYKGRSLTQEEIANISKLQVRMVNPFKEIDERADRTLPLFPDEQPNELGFKLLEDIRQAILHLTFEYDQETDTLKATETTLSAPLKNHHFFLIYTPQERLLYGVKKTEDVISSLTKLARFTRIEGVLAKKSNVKVVYLNFENRTIIVDDKFVNGDKITDKEKQQIEKAIRYYFKNHIPIKWGMAEKPEQLTLFQNMFPPEQEGYNFLYFLGGLVTLKNPVVLNIKNLQDLLNKLGVPKITPRYEIGLLICTDEKNNITHVLFMPSYQNKQEMVFVNAESLLRQLPDVRKIYFIHRHPAIKQEIILNYVKAIMRPDAEYMFLSLVKEGVLTENEKKEFFNLLKQLHDIIKQHLDYTSDEKIYQFLVNADRSDLRQILDKLGKYSFALSLSIQDIQFINKLKQYDPRIQMLTYIFNDYIFEFNLATNQKKIIPYKKINDFQVEKLKQNFEDLPPWFTLFYYQQIPIEFTLEHAKALVEYVNRQGEKPILMIKDNKIVAIQDLNGLLFMPVNFENLLPTCDYMIIYADPKMLDETTSIRIEEIVKKFEKPVYFVSSTTGQNEKVFMPEHFGIVRMGGFEKNKIYNNILKRYGNKFSEAQLKTMFEQRFGYPLQDVDSEDGLEFRRFLTKLLITPEQERDKIIEAWIKKQIDFTKVTEKIKRYIKQHNDRRELLKQLRLYETRNPEILQSFLKEYFNETDYRKLETKDLQRLVYWIALAEADENLRKTAEFLGVTEFEFPLKDKLRYGMSSLFIADSTLLSLSKKFPSIRHIRDEIVSYFREYTQLLGRCNNQLNEIQKILGKDFIDKKFHYFVDYVETGILSDNLTEKEKQKVLKAYQLYKDMMDWLYIQAYNAGVTMLDPLGFITPIQYRERYFPHMYEKDYLDDVERFEKLVKEVAERNRLTEDEARFLLEIQRKDLKSKSMKNLEMHRLYDIPGYKKTFDVLLKYVSSASERIAWVRHFGNDIFLAPGRGYMPSKLAELLKQIPNAEVRKYIIHIFDVLLYKHYHSFEMSNAILRAIRMLQIPKLSTAFIENMFQWFVNFAPKVSYDGIISALIKRLTTLGLGKQIIGFYGIGEQIGRALEKLYGEKKGDIFDLIATISLKMGFLQTERNNRVMLVFLGQEYIDQLRGWLKKGKVDKVVYELETLGVTKTLINKIKQQNDITKEDEFEIIWTANAMTNYLVDLWFMPFILGKSDVARTVLQFVGSFWIPQTRMITRLYIKPFFDFVRSGGKRGSVKGIAKFLVHAFVVSIITRTIRDFLARRRLIMDKKTSELFANLFYFVLLSGWFGMYSLPIEFFSYGTEQLKERFIGVGFNYLIELLDAFYTLNFPKVLEIQSPAVRYFMNWATKKFQHYAPPTYNQAWNWLRSCEKTIDFLKAKIGTEHWFTQWYYNNVYNQAYINFVKKYGGIHVKLKGQLPTRKYLTPTRRDIISRTPNL